MEDPTPADPAPSPAAVKAGYKTTEFWLTLITQVVGALAISGFFAEGSKEAKLIGLGGMILSGLGYTFSRGAVKKAALLVPLLLALALGGCGGLAAKTARDIDQAGGQILPEYLMYVDKDDKLDAPAKQRRRDQVRALQDVIRNAQK